MSDIPASNDLKPLLGLVASGTALSEAQATEAFRVLMDGAASDAQIGAFLMGLRVRGETVDEITAGAKALRERMKQVTAPPEAIDTCGTGGDAKGTYNISTAVTFVLAGAGVPVAKHGNRALSSKSGAADVLKALGVNLELDVAEIERAIREAGVGFLFAPAHHSAMRHVGPARQALGTRTIFNLLGPLANPAGVKRQLVGVFAAEWVRPLAEVLSRLGTQRAWVVHGQDGLDELTVTGETQVCELDRGTIREFTVTPEDAGLARASLADLTGGSAEENAEALKAVLAGAQNAYRETVLLNAAAALIVAEKCADLKEGAALAAQSIDSGHAAGALASLVAVTNEGAP